MKKQFYIDVLADLAAAITLTKSKIYIYGGFTIDIWENKILRDHHDIDTICIDLLMKTKEIVSIFESKGYTITFIPNGDLKIRKNDFGISMTKCEVIDNVAKWSPYGVLKSVYFPLEWFDNHPYLFENFLIYTVDKKFEYCLKNNPSFIKSDWVYRDDSIALNYINMYLISNNITIESFINEMYSK